MIEFILGGIIGHMIGSSGKQSYLGGDEFITIKTTGDAKAKLSDIFKKYDPLSYQPSKRFFENFDGEPDIVENNGFFESNAYSNRNNVMDHDKPEHFVTTTNIGKYCYIQIEIIHHSLYRKLTFDQLHLLKLLECIEDGASEKYIEWQKKISLNGVTIKKGENK